MLTTLTFSADIIGFTCGKWPVAGIRTGFKTPVPEPYPLSPPAVGLGAGLMGWPAPMIGGLCVPLPVAGTVVGTATGSVLSPAVVVGVSTGFVWPPVTPDGLCVPSPVAGTVVGPRTGSVLPPPVVGSRGLVWPPEVIGGLCVPSPVVGGVIWPRGGNVSFLPPPAGAPDWAPVVVSQIFSHGGPI